MKIYFSPKGGCAAAICAEIAKLKSGDKLHIQAYSFTSKTIIQAVAVAAALGVEIIVILDRSFRTEAPQAWEAFYGVPGITLLEDDAHAIAHNKVVICLGKNHRSVCTGSFNFTTQAEFGNAENLLVISTAPEIAAYEANFQRHLSHAKVIPPLPTPATLHALTTLHQYEQLPHTYEANH